MDEVINPDEVYERFIHDVADHQMVVKHQDGLYRHLTFQRNQSNVYRFDLITYPGHLVVSGDMGTYVWSRLPDMFQFFRDDGGKINPGYWSEKLQADEKYAPYKHWTKAKYTQVINELVEDYIEEALLVPDVADQLRTEVEDDILNWVDTEWEGHDRAQGFQSDVCDFEIQDFWEYNCQEYNYSYLWILYAIVWGIQQYDKG